MSNRYWKINDDLYIGDPFGEAVEITEDEFKAISLEKFIEIERRKRDTLLQEVVDKLNPMRWELLTETQKQAWRDYRQALLDVPQQEGFPQEIVWPVAPNETEGTDEQTGGEDE